MDVTANQRMDKQLNAIIILYIECPLEPTEDRKYAIFDFNWKRTRITDKCMRKHLDEEDSMNIVEHIVEVVSLRLPPGYTIAPSTDPSCSQRKRGECENNHF